MAKTITGTFSRETEMKLRYRYSKSVLRSRLFDILLLLISLKCGYIRPSVIECDWSVQRLSCPPYATTDWDCLQTRLNCTNGEKYHCLRDGSGEWTEVCAVPIACSKGQEPVLKNSHIVCTNCKNPERYEPVEGTESYKYSECRRMRTTCPPDITHECPVDEAVRHSQDRQCRCDHKQDYMPQNYDLNTDTWKCKEPDDLNCIHAPCPEDVYGNAQTRTEKYRCVQLLSPVPPTPSKKSTERISPHIVTQTPTRPNRDTGPAAETELHPSWLTGLIIGMLVVLSLSLILILAVYYMTRRYKIGNPECLIASDINYFDLTLSWEPPKTGYLPTHYTLEKREDCSLIWFKIDTISAAKTQYHVTGLKAGALYSFRVIAKAKWAKSKPLEIGYQARTKSITVPNAPRELTGDFDIKARCIHLRWKQPDDDGGSPIVEYLVTYSFDGNWTDYVSVKAKTEWISSNFTGGVSYNFRVCARNKVGSSVPAELKEKIKYLSVPGEPRDISATKIRSNKLTLSWKSPESDGGDMVTNFLIRQKEGELGWQQIQNVKSNTRSITVINIKPGKSYRFGIKAVNKVGESNWKETESPIVAREAVCPDPPQRVYEDLQKGHDHVVLSWKPPKDDGGSTLLGYVVEKERRLKNENIKALEPNITTLNIPKLTENTSYTFLVFAKNAIGKSDPLELNIKTTRRTDSKLNNRPKSETHSIEGSSEDKDSEQKNNRPMSETDSVESSSVDKGLSTHPTDLNISVKGTAVIVSWKPPTDPGSLKVKEYKVWLKRELDDWTVTQTVKAPKCQTEVKHLNPDLNYHFRVCAMFENGKQSDFTETDAPVVLQMKKGKLGRKSLKLKTQAGYQHENTILSDAEESAGTCDVQGAGTNEISSKSKEALPDKERTVDNPPDPLSELPNNENFAASAKRGMDMEKETIEEATEATEDTSVQKKTPGPPEDFTITQLGSKACTLRWKHPTTCGGSKCTGFVIKKKESDASAWIEVEELKPDVLTCTVRDLPYKDIYFSVASKNSFGIGQAAETDKPLSIKYTLEALQPAGPLECSVLTNCSVRLTWGSPKEHASAITGYIIEYSDTSETMTSWSHGGTVTPETTSWVQDKLQEDHEYIFRIISNSAKGNSKPLESMKMQIRSMRKGKEEIQDKRADGFKDKADGDATGGNAAETEGDAADGQEKEKKAFDMLRILTSIKDWNGFVRHAAGIDALLKDSWTIPNETVSQLTGASEYKPRSVSPPPGFTAFETSVKDNSLFRSVSLILFGNENYTNRLRLIAVADGISNRSLYLQQFFGEKDINGVKAFRKTCQSETFNQGFDKDRANDIDYLKEFIVVKSVRETAMPESKYNPLQVQFLSTATGFPIVQYFEKDARSFYESFYAKNAVEIVKPARTNTEANQSEQPQPCIYILCICDPDCGKKTSTVVNRVIPLFANKTEECSTQV